MTIHYTSPDNKLVIDNYPYGFNVRTTMYMWIETTSKGDRLVTQTINPRSGKLNKPKKSTYQAVKLIVEQNNKYSIIGIDLGWSSETDINTFISRLDIDQLNQLQVSKIKQCIAIAKTQKHIKVTIGGTPQTPEERKQFDTNIRKIYTHYLST